MNEHIDDTIVSYLDSIRLAENKNFAILLLKNIDSYPSLLRYSIWLYRYMVDNT